MFGGIHTRQAAVRRLTSLLQLATLLFVSLYLSSHQAGLTHEDSERSVGKMLRRANKNCHRRTRKMPPRWLEYQTKCQDTLSNLKYIEVKCFYVTGAPWQRTLFDDNSYSDYQKYNPVELINQGAKLTKNDPTEIENTLAAHQRSFFHKTLSEEGAQTTKQGERTC